MNRNGLHPNKWVNRFWSITGAVSVRMKILGIALLLVLMLGLMAILVTRTSMQQVVRHELELRSASIAEDLSNRATDSILVNNKYLLNRLISETKATYSDIRYIFVVDTKGQVLAHTFGVGFPLELLSANSAPGSEASHVVILDTTEGPIWDAVAPIFEGRVGSIRLGLSDALLGRTVTTVTTQLILATLLVSTFGILLAIFLTRVLTRPIQELAHIARAVGQGDLNQKVTHWVDDEIGELADSFNTMVKNLRLAEEANQERQRLRTELVERVISAQEEERKRISCDLHDQTSQALVSLIVQLKLVETAPNEAVRRKNLDILREQLRSTLGEVRQMALDLRPSILDDLGLEQAVRSFGERCTNNNGLQVSISCQGELNTLPERHTITSYRVVQEALSNVVKHSQAQHAQVEICYQPEMLLLKIQDDGIGFDQQRVKRNGSSLGILGMQERVALLGGQIEIHGAPGQGATIIAQIPVPLTPICSEPANTMMEVGQ